MSPSRIRSFAEVLLNTFTGLFGSCAITFTILKWSPYGPAVNTALICVACSIWSLAWGYGYRRLFNRGESRSLPQYLQRIDRLTRQRDSARRACGQASFALRELLPDHPDARLTIAMIDLALTPSSSTRTPQARPKTSLAVATAATPQSQREPVDSGLELPLHIATTIVLDDGPELSRS